MPVPPVPWRRGRCAARSVDPHSAHHTGALCPVGPPHPERRWSWAPRSGAVGPRSGAVGPRSGAVGPRSGATAPLPPRRRGRS